MSLLSVKTQPFEISTGLGMVVMYNGKPVEIRVLDVEECDEPSKSCIGVANVVYTKLTESY